MKENYQKICITEKGTASPTANNQFTNSQPGMLKQSSKTRSGNSCTSCLYWALQIIVWLSLTFFFVVLIFYNEEVEMRSYAIGIFCFVYLIYLIASFTSHTCKYLNNKKSNSNMYITMGNLFRTQPTITFHVECYHYETRYYYSSDSRGHRHRHSRVVKIVTYSGQRNLRYYSSRDVSGLFLLNCTQETAGKKKYIKLELEEEINFAMNGNIR